MDPKIIVIFLAVTALIGVIAFMFRGGNEQTATRLDILVGKRGKSDSSPESLLRKGFAEEGEQKTIFERIADKFPKLDRIFEQADCHIKPSSLFFVSAVLAGVGVVIGVFAKAPPYFWPFTALVMATIPWIWLWNKRRVRLNKFAAQLPDGMELVARALRAGHSLQAGLHVVGEEMPAPICEEFNRCYEEQNLGIPIEEALRNMAERVPNLDLRFFVTSVAIQRQTGGDLAEILDKIGYIIRERYRILGQVKALTAEGRLSGVVLIALPFGLFLFMLNMKPDYVDKLWTTEKGRQMSVFALIMQVLGAAVIKKIVDIKV